MSVAIDQNKVSVVIPMYNSKDTIIRALDSVKNQTAFQEIGEIIVVNDGSKDDSLEIVKKYCEAHTEMPIKIIDKENGGVSSARNAGLRVAKGEFIALLDSDDEWLPEKIKVQLDILNNIKDIDLIATTSNNQKFKRFFLKKFENLTDIKVTDLIYKNFFSPPTVIFRKSLLDKIGLFPEEQRYAEEGNFFMKAAYSTRCTLLNESYSNCGNGKFSFGDRGLSANLVEMQKGEIRNLKFAKQQKYITYSHYFVAFIFSYIKYIRRIVITKVRKGLKLK